MLELVDAPGLNEFNRQLQNQADEDFDDFDAVPCPQDWDRLIRQQSSFKLD